LLHIPEDAEELERIGVELTEEERLQRRIGKMRRQDMSKTFRITIRKGNEEKLYRIEADTPEEALRQFFQYIQKHYPETYKKFMGGLIRE